MWLIQHVADVPIYRRWIVTQAGAKMLVDKIGAAENIGLEQLASIPEIRPS